MTTQAIISNSTKRAELIEQIIDKRKPMVERIETASSNLRSLDSSVQSLITHSDEILANSSQAVLKTDIQNRLGNLRGQLHSTLATLAKLKTRFGRDTVNIGVVGRARQGKSRLLRSMTGLSEKVIPDGGGGFCTGVRSKINHHADKPEKEASARVHFYSPDSFLEEVIEPCYSKLQLGELPNSLDSLASDAFPVLPAHNKNDEFLKSIYGNFRKKYSGKLSEYRHLIEGPAFEDITEDKIRSYVTQENANYIAVREVEISCRFPQENVGKISLIDLPGLGDLNYIDEERLTKTLNQEVDFILFVRRPDGIGDAWKDSDVKLYESARRSLESLPIANWSFMILNRVRVEGNETADAKNLQACEHLRDNMGLISVSDCMIVDCSNESDVQNLILDEILNYLISNIENLDRQYAGSCQDEIKRLQSKTAQELESIGTTIKNSTPDLLFEDRFPILWETLSRGLNKLVDELKVNCQKAAPDFEKEVEDVIDKCRDTARQLPSKEAIEQRRHQTDGYASAILEYIPEMRAALSKQFLYLDGQLQGVVDVVKSNILNVLKNEGHLNELARSEHGFKQDTFHELTLASQALRNIAQCIPGENKELSLAFKTLANFNVSYSGVIQVKVRRCLDVLDSDLTVSSGQIVQTLETSKGTTSHPITAEAAQRSLAGIYKSAIDNCQEVLRGMLNEPNEVAYVMTREFVDRALRSRGVQREWRKVLSLHKTKIWPEFKQIENQERQLARWHSLIAKAKEDNTGSSLSIF